jgi:hypothetical protein
VKAKGGRIHTEPVTCHRCHKKEGAEHYARTVIRTSMK